MQNNLLHYSHSRYSQSGEDGIISEICRRLGIKTGWFVEFGAWDGKHLSNTYNLLAHHDWQGVDIEGSAERYQNLLRTQAAFPGRLHTLCTLVDVAGENALDNLLARTPVPLDYDLLSIDVDSIDWQIWNSVVKYQPKIVVIECNNLLRPGKLQLHDPPRHIGASFSSLVELGAKKGYQLVCHTGNCFFVRKELVPALQLDPADLQSPDRLFNYRKYRRETLIELGRTVLPKGVMNLLFKASFKWKRMWSKK